MKWMVTFICMMMASASLCMSFDGSIGNPGHRQSFMMVMEGLYGGELNEAYKSITDAADTLCKERFGEIGMMKNIKNHRYMGHWGWSSDIPEEVFERAEKLKVPKKEIIGVWQRIHKETVESVIKKTGLPPKAADAFAGLLYDTHLLHDYTGHFSDALQNPRAIGRDVVKQIYRLFGNNSPFAHEIKNEISQVIKNIHIEDQPREIFNILKRHQIGSRLCKVYGRFLAANGIQYSQAMAVKTAMSNAPINEQYFFRAFSTAVKGCGQKIDKYQIERVVKGVYSEVQVNGKKAYRLQVPLQFSTEDRIAYQYAKEISNVSNGNISQERIAELIGQRLRDPDNLKDASNNVIVNLNEEQIKRKAANAAQWIKHCYEKRFALGVRAGILTFIMMEGRTVWAFSETDMSEDEFWRQTTKNMGGAFLEGSAVTCLVALGANPFTWPSGLIVLGVSIGTNVIYNFAWSHIERHLDSQYFTLDDFIGNLPVEIQDRTTVFSFSDFDMVYHNNLRRLNTIDYIRHLEAEEKNSVNVSERGMHSNSLCLPVRQSPIDFPVRHENVFDCLKK